MRKNKTMRAAALMLALTLITSCFVGGTFAKYTTKGSATDSARVAEFGVTVAVENADMFNKTYKSHTAEYTSVTVEADEKVVAPGTSSADDGSEFKFSIKGTPEVAVKVTLDATDTKDVYLKGGIAYKDWTVAPYEETFKLDNDYYPVKWTLKVNDANGGEYLLGENTTLAEIQKNVEAYVTSYAPGEQLDADFTLSWAWAFENEDVTGEATENTVSIVDKADTLLGNLAADAGTYGKDMAVDSYNTTLGYNFTITVTQID